MNRVLEAARALAESEASGALVTILSGTAIGSRFLLDRDGALLAGSVPPGIGGHIDAVTRAVAVERTGTVQLEGAEALVEVIAPAPTLRLFGAGPIAEALCRLAARAGFRVMVGDPRAHLVTEDRFPDAIAVESGWPDDLLQRRPLDHRSFVVSVLHEVRFEDALLPHAAQSAARYVGALGSKKTHAARLERLAELGVSPEDLERIRGPVGLPIGAATPEEIAVSILAEMVQARRG